MQDTTDGRGEHYILRKPTDDERRQTTAEASSFPSHMARRKNGTPVNQKWKKAAHVAAVQAWREWK